MNEQLNMQKQYRALDAGAVPDQPEGGALSSDMDEKEVVQTALRVRMVERRHAVPCPDIDAEWSRFSRKHGIGAAGTSGASRRGMRPWVAAVLGAAAMLLCVWCYDYALRKWMGHDADSAIVVLSHDNAPAHVVLRDGEELFDVSSVDSLSYFEDKGKVVAMAAASHTPDTVLRGAHPAIQRLSTPRGMDFKVILPDGSEVWLNAESTIEFPAAFTDRERRVVLHGEAFFKVARDEHSPFVVSTDRMDVRVLGTEFNFRNYNHDAPHVSLVKGSVLVYTKAAEELSGATLKPGEGAWCDKEGDLHVGEDDIYAATQWVEGFFYFDNRPLVDVLQELGRWYNLGVVFKRREVMDYKMHFSASRDGHIDEVIRNLNRLRKVKVSLEGQNLVVY